jgi:superfamily II DNA helicase RecQ
VAPVPIVKAAAAAAAQPAPDARQDSLRERLRAWRRELAKLQGMPPYVILHDATIDALCRQRPRNAAELLEVPGIGERKAERFGARILELIAEGG